MSLPKSGFVVLLFSLCFARTAAAQDTQPLPPPPFSLQTPEAESTREDAINTLRATEACQFKTKREHPLRTHKTSFIALSTGVYAASLLDMQQTLKVRKLSWWYETDPLARPFSRLPAPAYYATGLAMATGVNWLSWKMSHSRKWRKLSFLPQALATTGNIYGFRSNRH